MKISDQFMRELDDLRSVELYHAYNSDHMESRHINVDDRDLKMRLAKVPFVDDEINLFSRFYGRILDVLPMVYTCICVQLTEVEKWDPDRDFLVLHMDFAQPIGCGLVKGTDWSHPFPMSRLRVILGSPLHKGRLFSVKTAYPVPNLDEVDEIWDAIDTYAEQLKEMPAKKTPKTKVLSAYSSIPLHHSYFLLLANWAITATSASYHNTFYR